MKVYAGVGSRKTQKVVLDLMWRTAVVLRRSGWTCRSGHADGADKAFEDGARQEAEIYLPWPSYNGRVVWAKSVMPRPQPEAYTVAAQLHPDWSSCKSAVRALHARNVHIVAGPDLIRPSLARFMICWTPGARTYGGTGMTIRIAEYFGVEIFNLALARDRERLEGWEGMAA